MMHINYTSTDDINVQKGFEYFKNLVFAYKRCFCSPNRCERNLILITVCYYQVTYEFQSEPTLYSLPECQVTPCSEQVPYLKFK